MATGLGDTAAEAHRLVTTDRNKSYGDPRDDWGRTVELFRLITGHQLTAAEGIKFMLCVKLSREANKHKADNIIDLCGYADLLNYVEDGA